MTEKHRDEEWLRYMYRYSGYTHNKIADFTNVTGEDHPTYVGGGSCEWRDESEWRLRRDLIVERDEHECTNCGAEENLHVHHITPVSRGGDKHDPCNLATLCQECHFDAHSDIYSSDNELDSVEWISENNKIYQ